MELNQLAFVAEKRSPWQVFDLSQLVTLKYFVPMVKIYLGVMLPFALLAYFALPITYSSLLVWWLKPLYERPLLDFLAKKSFSLNCSTTEALASLKSLRIIDVVKMLTLYRLSPNRAFLAPVEQLEKLKAKASSQRKNLLLGRFQHKQTWWLLLCVHFELLLTIAIASIIIVMLPKGVEVDTQFLWQGLNDGTFDSLYFFIYLIVISLVAPFFTTGGFLMYLNCRIALEGWDIELSFKRMVQRLAVSGACILLCFGAIPDKAYALESSAQASTTQTVEPQKLEKNEYLTQVKKQVDDIYRDHELIDTQVTWLPKPSDKKQDTNWLKGILDFFSVLSAISPFIGYFFWGLLLAVVVWLVWRLWLYYQKYSGGFERAKSVKYRDNKEAEQTLPSFLADITEQAWPDDLLLAAEQALGAAKYRLALACLLRHALLYVEQLAPRTLSSAMTEYECQRALAKIVKPELNRHFQQLFALWLKHAWGHKSVKEQDIAELISKFRITTEQVQHG